MYGPPPHPAEPAEEGGYAGKERGHRGEPRGRAVSATAPAAGVRLRGGANRGAGLAFAVEQGIAEVVTLTPRPTTTTSQTSNGCGPKTRPSQRSRKAVGKRQERGLSLKVCRPYLVYIRVSNFVCGVNTGLIAVSPRLTFLSD